MGRDGRLRLFDRRDMPVLGRRGMLSPDGTQLIITDGAGRSTIHQLAEPVLSGQHGNRQLSFTVQPVIDPVTGAVHVDPVTGLAATRLLVADQMQVFNDIIPVRIDGLPVLDGVSIAGQQWHQPPAGSVVHFGPDGQPTFVNLAGPDGNQLYERHQAGGAGRARHRRPARLAAHRHHHRRSHPPRPHHHRPHRRAHHPPPTPGTATGTGAGSGPVQVLWDTEGNLIGSIAVDAAPGAAGRPSTTPKGTARSTHPGRRVRVDPATLWPPTCPTPGAGSSSPPWTSSNLQESVDCGAAPP